MIFKREDFTLCVVPVPEGYPQSQTHCGVAFHEDKLLMITSPYPAVKNGILKTYSKALLNKLRNLCSLDMPRNAESYENPCLYISKDKEHTPVNFSLVQKTPLMECPNAFYGLPAYNSDPDLFVEGDTSYILNRVVYRMPDKDGQKQFNIRLHLISGKIEDEKFRFQKNVVIEDSFDRMLISPCLIKVNDVYMLFELETNSYNDGITFNGLFCKVINPQTGKTISEDWKHIQVSSGDWLPWHMSVFQNDGVLYAIVTCVKKGEGHRCWQMFGEFSEDLKHLRIYQTPLTDYKSYRSSAIVEKGQFILYNSVVHESINRSSSVDGRDIMMAFTDFKEMLNRLKYNESE